MTHALDATQPDAETYVVEAIIGFLNDPPGNDFTKGWERGLRTMYLDLWGNEQMRRLAAEGDLDWNEVMRSTS